jgi:hypothetical protein
MAANSASADYGNTMRFEWTAPEGSIITSQSGAFITPSNFAPGPVTSTPEPAPLPLLGAGLAAGVLTLRRRTARRRAAVRRG